MDVVLLRQLGPELDKGFWWYLLFFSDLFAVKYGRSA